MGEIRVVQGDLLDRPCDVLILKHAEGFYGADGIVAERIGFKANIPEGNHAFSRGNNIEARKVLFLGVGTLQDFRYDKIRSFAYKTLSILKNGEGKSEIICSPIHGPGYGLDEKEAFFSLVKGYLEAIRDGQYPADLRYIEIVEKNEKRANRLKSLLRQIESNEILNSAIEFDSKKRSSELKKLESFGEDSENKPTLFVAMPFAEQYSDIYEVAIVDMATKTGIKCEIISDQYFSGDIVTEIKKRIDRCSGLIGVLDGANPNVFLEIGYAWAKQKPTILIASKGTDLPFDVKGQRCILYKNMNDLRSLLIKEMDALVQQGVIPRP